MRRRGETIVVESGDLPPASLKIGEHDYYTTGQIAAAISEVAGVPIPEYHLLEPVRRGELHGQKIGKAYVVSAEEFRRWVESGNFRYTRRRRGSRDE